MTTAAETETHTYRYKALGFTDDINTCDLCGRVELKGTVRLVIRDNQGDEDGEIYAGVTCAAKANGCTAKTIRGEAKHNEDLARATYRAWGEDCARARDEFWEEARTRLGLPANAVDLDLPRDQRWPTWRAAQDRVRADETYQARVTAWLVEHPEPVNDRPPPPPSRRLRDTHDSDRLPEVPW